MPKLLKSRKHFRLYKNHCGSSFGGGGGGGSGGRLGDGGGGGVSFCYFFMHSFWDVGPSYISLRIFWH